MANDRIFLKCKSCGKTFMLAKYYPTLGHGLWGPNHYERLDKFFMEHMRCSPQFGKISLNGDSCFTLFTESDSKFNELYDPVIRERH